MGNQSAVFRTKNSHENCNQYFMTNKPKSHHLEVFNDRVYQSKTMHYSPLSLRLRRPPPLFDQSDEKSKEFFDDIQNTIPTVFRWVGKGKSIAVSGSFNNWKANIPLARCDSVTSYTIINCIPGSHVYKFLIDGTWYHDPDKPTVKNSYGTYDNVMEVKQSDSIICDAILNDEYWCTKHCHGTIDEISLAGEYTQDLPSPTIKTCKEQPMTLPPSLNESILDLPISPYQEPSLLPHPQHVQVNHMYASSIKDGIVCLSMTIRYRSKFITVILYNTIPL